MSGTSSIILDLLAERQGVEARLADAKRRAATTGDPHDEIGNLNCWLHDVAVALHNARLEEAAH
jgi:hypothetical protein